MILSHRIYTSTLIGLSGACVMLAMTSPGTEPAMVMVAAAGALCAGLPVAGLFGGRGAEGAWAAFAGALMATGLGAALAGCALALAMGFAGAVIMAPVAVIGAIVTQPLATIVWAGSMAGVHFLTRLAREEAPY